MRKEQLFQFIEVVDCGSINKAAEKLYISQPNLSRSIHALEEDMGKALIIRNNRGVTLTPTGKMLYYYARSILNQFQVLERLKELDAEQIYSQLSISVDSLFLKDDMILNFYNNRHYQVDSGQSFHHRIMAVCLYPAFLKYGCRFHLGNILYRYQIFQASSPRKDL